MKKRNGQARRWMLLPVDQATDKKWREGEEEYGPDWVGDHPLVELHTEQLDSLNYIQVGRRWGDIPADVAEEMRYHILEVVRACRLLAPDVLE